MKKNVNKVVRPLKKGRNELFYALLAHEFVFSVEVIGIPDFLPVFSQFRLLAFLIFYLCFLSGGYWHSWLFTCVISVEVIGIPDFLQVILSHLFDSQAIFQWGCMLCLLPEKCVEWTVILLLAHQKNMGRQFLVMLLQTKVC